MKVSCGPFNREMAAGFVCLLLFDVLATSKVIFGHLPTVKVYTHIDFIVLSHLDTMRPVP